MWNSKHQIGRVFFLKDHCILTWKETKLIISTWKSYRQFPIYDQEISAIKVEKTWRTTGNNKHKIFSYIFNQKNKPCSIGRIHQYTRRINQRKTSWKWTDRRPSLIGPWNWLWTLCFDICAWYRVSLQYWKLYASSDQATWNAQTKSFFIIAIN